MARAIEKQIEGAIALTIYILFLLFYIGAVKFQLFNKITTTNVNENYYIFLEKLTNNLSKDYYIININLSIPLASREYICSNDKYLCENFPVFYPFNVSFITNKYTGVVNGSFYSFLDGDGIFMYANLSKFKCKSKSYVLFKIYNPNSYDLSNYQVFITSPTIRYWLSNGFRIKVLDDKGNLIKFCYHHKNFVCNDDPNGAYGIWILIDIPKYSTKIINVSLTQNNYAVDGSSIFVFYDHFTDPSLPNWKNTSADCEAVNDTIVECSYDQYKGTLTVTLYSKYKIPAGSYEVFYKVNSSSLSNKLVIGDNEKYLDDYFGFRYWSINLDENSPISISMRYESKLWLDYLIVKKIADYDVIIKRIDGPTCYRRYSLIVGPYIINNQRDDLKCTNTYIANSYYVYDEITNTLEDDGTKFFEELYVGSYLGNQSKLCNNKYVAYENKFIKYAENYTMFLKKIVFSNSPIFITTLEFISNNPFLYNNPLFYWNYGELFPSTQSSYVCTDYISEKICYNNIDFARLLDKDILFNDYDDSKALLIATNMYYNYLIYYYKRTNIRVPILFKKKNEYAYIPIYYYIHDGNLSLDFKFYFYVPEVKILSIRKVRAIPIERITLSNNIYADFGDKKLGNSSVLKSYSFSMSLPLWIFYNNTLKKVNAKFYIK